MRLWEFPVLTFDTYGTLIDWETGILAALEGLLAAAPERPTAETALERFAEVETAVQAEQPQLRYSDLLAVVHRRLADGWGAAPDNAAAAAFGGSVGDWPAFPDAADALARLGERHTLITLTNCDRVSYAGSAARLGEPWDAIYTAEDIGSYKPDPANFAYLLARVRDEFGRGPGDILHVAQSLFHDHAPAQAAGLTTVWIDRRAGKAGSGATAPAEGARYDARFESMAAFATAMETEGA